MPIEFYQTSIDLIKLINRNRFRISHSLQTNAMLLNQQWCEFIKHHNIKIGVSIDGPAHIHDAYRKTRSNKGTFIKAIKGIELLNKNDVEFHVITVLTKESLDYPEELFDFYRTNNITRVGFNVEEVEGIHLQSSLEADGIIQKYRNFISKFLDSVIKSEHELILREFKGLTNIISNEQQVYQSKESTPISILNFDCEGNFSTFSPELLGVETNKYGKFVLGNILENSLEEVFQTEGFLQIYSDIKNGIKKCRDTCEYFDLCGGGAPANKLFENGKFDSTETLYCKLSKKNFIDIALESIETM